MNIQRSDLEALVVEGVLTTEQPAAIWAALERRGAGRARFDLVHVAYYAGALIVIGAMSYFLNEAWNRFDGGTLALIAAFYAFLFATASWFLISRAQLRIPGGLLLTVAVCMTPMVVYGIERMTGLWPQGDPGDYSDYYVWVKGSWIGMEVATVAAGLIALRFLRFPFLTAPIAFSLWFLSMDLAPLLFGQDTFEWDQRLWVSLVVGLLMLVAAYVLDRSGARDFAGWIYLFGMLAFWCGLTLMDGDSEVTYAGYALVNIVLILLSVFLLRRVFVVFGAIGLMTYLGHLASTLFADSLLFPVALTVIGLGVMGVGIVLQRNHARIEAALLGTLPPWVLRLRPTTG
jgi:hypothetical protein